MRWKYSGFIQTCHSEYISIDIQPGTVFLCDKSPVISKFETCTFSGSVIFRCKIKIILSSFVSFLPNFKRISIFENICKSVCLYTRFTTKMRHSHKFSDRAFSRHFQCASFDWRRDIGHAQCLAPTNKLYIHIKIIYKLFH